MKIKGVFVFLLVSCLLSLVSNVVEAQFGQFGKNNVRYSQLDQFYESFRFDIWHNLDTSDPVQKEYLEMIIANLENARDWMGGQQIYDHTIEKRIPVFLYKTHTDMESSNLVGGFLPEGVGAFAEPERKRMALRADFSKPLSRAIGVHELAHEFQFDIWSPGIWDNLNPLMPVRINRRRPQWFYEGGAEFIASLYEPHTRGDIRRDDQRITSSDRHFIPTWEALNLEQVNPYSGGAMVFEFLQEKFDVGAAFQIQGFKQSRVELGELLYDLTEGELGNPDANSEKFNQAITRFWMDKYGDEFNARPKPDEKNDNFEGRLIMPWGHSAPMSSPVLSPDGMQLAAFTVFKYGVGLGKYEVPKDKLYVPKEEREKLVNEDKSLGSNGLGELVNLTPQLPPVPWEGVISQLQTWPFNGFDASWSPDGSKIAFFAKIRDHALIIIDSNAGKVLRKIELPLVQAFSPSFSPNGEWVYFSAADKDTTRDIWAVYVGNSNEIKIQRITDNKNFATAPVVSPDGTKIVYVDQDDDFQHLFLYHVGEGEQEQLTFGPFNDGWPNWSDDGSTLVFASDEADGTWNLHTLELSTRTVRQWTEFLLGVKTPIFAKGATDTVYYVSPVEDTQSGAVYDKVFEAKFKKPIREYTARNTGPAGRDIFNPSRDPFKFQLDENQLLNPKEPPERWKCGGGEISFGMSTYWGMFGQGFLKCSNLLETKQHSALFLTQGSFRIIDYSYGNQEKRTGWALGAHQYRMPYFIQFYDVVHRYPAQYVLNNTWMIESALDLHTEYPWNKFNRLELFSSLRNHSFSLFGYNVGDLSEEKFENNQDFTEQDFQVYRFLRNSAGSNFVFGAAYVRDTVLYSGNTWGPFHGNAFRVQVEFAPPLGEELQGYTSANVSARTYRHWGSNTVIAGRVDAKATTKANGDFVLFCGPEMLRGCEYGSIVGNQVGYASAELRFPVPGTSVLFAGVRGFLFTDMAYARFSDESFSVQKLRTYGFGAQYVIPFIGLPAQSVWTRDNGKWKPTFYITLHW